MIDPFHLISTPVAVLPGTGLITQVGLSGEDPGAARYSGQAFSVWVTVYTPEGRRVERSRVAALAAGERRVLDLTGLTAPHGFERPFLCVVHRVPEPIPPGHLDFDMYRCVVQYARPGGGRGSVIYETPPRLNAKPGGAFLCFTNQVVVGGGMSTKLVALHYSVSEVYAQEAKVRLLVHAPDGRRLLLHDAGIPAFTPRVLDLGAMLGEGGSPGSLQRSLVVCSGNASLIPLLLNEHEPTGGVSVEHTHPPISYLAMPVADAMRVRGEAIARYLEARA
jgi:hypothetical protein